MGVARNLKLVLCIADQAVRDKFRDVLGNLARSGALAAKIPGYRFEIACSESRPEAIEAARQHLDADESHAAILVFDPRDSKEESSWGEEARGAIKARCGTIAILDPPRRLRDIDRVISPTADSEKLLDVLMVVTDRLTYTSSPAPRISSAPAIEVRLIRRQRELMDYFKLRHRVYRIMGYLNEEIENAPSRMEIDWCDTTALHFGAYAGSGERRDTLVGTARVVVSSAETNRKQAILNSYRKGVNALLEADPVLKQSVNRGVLTLELPIFQSQKLFDLVREILKRGEACGELSRVIVAEEYRGAGVSTRLVEFALSEAARLGVQRIFLECLALHEALYGKRGFRRIPGTAGIVFGVNQTMIGMELLSAAGS